MDEHCPILKRPKRKLCYYTTNESQHNKWKTQKIVTEEDIDKLFNDLDTSTIHIPKNKTVARNESPLPLKEDLSEEISKCYKVSNRAHSSPSTSLELDIGTPFKISGPVKMSSPIKGNSIPRQPKEKHKKDSWMSPIRYDCEDEKNQEVTADKPSKKQNDDDSFFESLSSKSVLTKMSTQKKAVATRQKTQSPPVSPVWPKPTSGAPEKPTQTDPQVPTQAKPNVMTFLQKLRDAEQPKPSRSRMSLVKVVPPPPEPEDDFLILEDDSPLWVSIPFKADKKLKQNKTSRSNKGTKESSVESVDNQEIEQESDKLEGENSDGKPKKMKRGYDSHTTESDRDKHVLSTIEPANTDDVSDQSKTNKNKKQMKKVLSKDVNQKDKGTGSTEKGDEKPLTKTETKTVEKKGSNSLKNNKGDAQKKRSLGSKESRKETKETNAVNDAMEEQSQECSGADLTDNVVLGVVSEVVNKKEPAKDFEKGNLKLNKLSSSFEESSDEKGRLPEKRKRNAPGHWWMSCCQSPAQNVTDIQTTIRKSKQANKNSSGAAAVSPVKATTAGGLRGKKLKTSSSSSERQKANKKRVKKTKVKATKRERPAITKPSESEVFVEPMQDKALDEDSSDFSPVVFSQRARRVSSGFSGFHQVYSSSEKLSLTPEHASSRSPEEQLSSEEPTKRRRNLPGNWWAVNSSVLEQPKPKKHKAAGERRKLPNDCRPFAMSYSSPPGGAPVPKQRDLCSTVTVSPSVNKKSGPKLNKRPNTTSAKFVVSDHSDDSMTPTQSRSVKNCPLNHQTQELTSFRSGPSSMIELRNFEESNNDIVLPSSRVVRPALSATDLCAPPLKPLILLPKDKVNLTEWLKSLWSTTAGSGAEITPDHFKWYYYRDRAFGLMVDIQSGTICNGKMLLGSFMKKPLWVDHSSTTVFNLLTSSVSVIIDCKKSIYNPGQAFMVPPGHAYSIHNLSAEPAVLYFSRIFAEELDE